MKFIQGDLFDADINEATVVTLFLEWNQPPAAPPLGASSGRAPGSSRTTTTWATDWPPAKRIATNGKTVYLYVVPERK